MYDTITFLQYIGSLVFFGGIFSVAIEYANYKIGGKPKKIKKSYLPKVKSFLD